MVRGPGGPILVSLVFFRGMVLRIEAEDSFLYEISCHDHVREALIPCGFPSSRFLSISFRNFFWRSKNRLRDGVDKIGRLARIRDCSSSMDFLL